MGQRISRLFQWKNQLAQSQLSAPNFIECDFTEVLFTQKKSSYTPKNIRKIRKIRKKIPKIEGFF